MGSYLADRLVDIPCYLLVVGCVEGLALGIVGILALAFVRSWGWRTYGRRVALWSLFAFVLLLVGCFGNSVFMVLAYERWYVSADTVVDFVPFIPFGQWVLETRFGPDRGRLLGGATLLQLQALWGGVSVLVWCVSLAVFRRIEPLVLRSWRRDEAAQRGTAPAEARKEDSL